MNTPHDPRTNILNLDSLPLPFPVEGDTLSESHPFSLHRYELKNVIASGGMGSVYRAFDTVLQRPVAIKVIHEKIARSESAHRFNEEAIIMGQLQHPSIPPVYDLGVLADGRPFLAMKLIEGQTLESLIRKYRDALNVLSIFESIAQAIGYAHSRGVIHRDLKPGNIMVGEFGEVQVMDWGLAKILCTEEKPGEHAETRMMPVRAHDTPLTVAGTVMGTPAYMAPEQASGQVGLTNERADVFGLGGILYTMLTGEPPYQNNDIDTLRLMMPHSILNPTYEKLDACGAAADVIALARRCLAVEPADRPANGDEVARIVAKLRQDADSRAKQAEFASQTSEARRRWLLNSGAMVIAVLLLGMALTVGQLKRARAAEQEKDQQLVELEEARKQANRNAELANQNSELAKKNALLAKEQAVRAEQQAFRAEQQAALAEQQAALAEKHKQIAVEKTKKIFSLYNEIVFLFSDKLKDIPAARDVRRGLLETATSGLTAALEESQEMANAYTTNAGGHLLLGDIYDDLGQSAKAESAYRSGIRIALFIYENTPPNLEIASNLRGGYDRLSLLLLRTAKLKEAAETLEKQLALCQKIAKDYPGELELQSNLTLTLERMGDLQAKMGKLPESIHYYQKQYDVDRELLRRSSGNQDVMRSIGIACHKIGDSHFKLGNIAEAEKWLQESLGIRTGLLLVNPSTMNCLSMAAILDGMGNVAVAKGNIPEALKYREQSLELAIELFDGDPKNVTFLFHVSTTSSKLAEVKSLMGLQAEAKGLYQKNIDIRKRLTEVDPANAQFQFYLAKAHIMMAQFLLNHGQSKEALGHYAATSQLLEPIAQDPNNSPVHFDFAQSMEGQGVCYMNLHEYDKAVGWFEKAMKFMSTVPRAELLAETRGRMEGHLASCRNMEKLLADVEFVHKQPVENRTAFYIARTRELLHRKQGQEALATARHFAKWANISDFKPNDTRYDAACCLAICADVASSEKVKVVAELLDLLEKAKKEGYFVPTIVAHFRSDTDFTSVRQEKAFQAFDRTLSIERERAPLPRGR